MEFQRILIIKPSSLGDIIHALPCLSALRTRFPKSYLAWFVNEKWANILEDHPDLDETIPWSFHWTGLMGLFRIFRRKKFDLAVDLQGLFRSGVISYLSGAQTRVGFRYGREGSALFYTDKVNVPTASTHAIDRYLLVAEYLGATSQSPASRMIISKQDDRVVEDLLKARGISGSQPFVAMSPTARWRTKRWPIERFAKVADQLQDSGMPAVLVGAHGDITEIERLRSLMKKPCISVAGEITLKQLAGLLKRARVLITNDSGPMHLAVSVGTPVVSLFGPTDPVRTGPYPRDLNQQPLMNTIIRKPVECSPCLRRWCQVGDHRCMMQIEVEEVLESVKKALSR
jgi:heptosyltransferase I